MKRAEEAALKAYPEDVWIDPNSWGIVSDPPKKDYNKEKRAIYQQGYEQAYRDFALTWKDMVEIRRIMFNINKRISSFGLKFPSDEEYGKEVLRRFLESKNQG